jgi:hypothetical protein
MVGSSKSALLVLWLWHARVSLGYTYELRPQVTFSGGSGSGAVSQLVVGSFAGYGEVSPQKWKGNLLAPDPTYGCPDSNVTLSSGGALGSIVVLPLSECSDYLQAERAAQDRATGVVFYTSDSDKDWWTSGEGTVSIPVAVVELWDEVLDHLPSGESPAYTQVSIEGKHYAVPPQQRTFYFIVTAFCILILLSCLWFFTSYFRRCRYTMRNRRRQVRSYCLVHVQG